MRPLVALVFVALVPGARVAHAEPAGEVREDAEPAEPAESPQVNAGDRFLHLDPTLRVSVDNLGSRIEHVERQLALGRRARVVLQTEWRDDDHDAPLRGWRIAASGTYDLGGGIDVSGSIGMEQIDSDHGRHSLRTLAIAVGKRFRISRTVHGWFGVAATTRDWIGEPPPGEFNSQQILATGSLSY